MSLCSSWVTESCQNSQLFQPSSKSVVESKRSFKFFFVHLHLRYQRTSFAFIRAIRFFTNLFFMASSSLLSLAIEFLSTVLVFQVYWLYWRILNCYDDRFQDGTHSRFFTSTTISFFIFILFFFKKVTILRRLRIIIYIWRNNQGIRIQSEHSSENVGFSVILWKK